MALVEERMCDRRIHKTAFRYPERRTGFDPRRPSPVLERLRDDRSLLLAVLIALNVLSLADWLLTMRALRNGAVEANMLLSGLMSQSMFAAGAFKLLVILGVSLLVWSARAYKRLLAAMVLAVGVFVVVIVYHLAVLTVAGAL
jgi:hypothetical protein